MQLRDAGASTCRTRGSWPAARETPSATCASWPEPRCPQPADDRRDRSPDGSGCRPVQRNGAAVTGVRSGKSRTSARTNAWFPRDFSPLRRWRACLPTGRMPAHATALGCEVYMQADQPDAVQTGLAQQLPKGERLRRRGDGDTTAAGLDLAEVVADLAVRIGAGTCRGMMAGGVPVHEFGVLIIVAA